MATLSWRKDGKFSKRWSDGAVAYICEKVKKYDGGKNEWTWVPDRVSLKTGDRATAKEALNQYELDKARGARGMLNLKREWSSFLPEYLRLRKVDVMPVTFKKDSIVAGYCTEICKPAYVSDLTQDKIELYKFARKETGIGNGTLRTELFCLKAICEKAIELKYLAEDPFKNVEIPDSPDNERKAMSQEHADRILAAALEHRYESDVIGDLYHMAMFFYYVGTRLAEFKAQRREWINLQTGWVTVRGVKRKKERFRLVKIHAHLMPILAERLGESKEGLLFEHKIKGGPISDRTIQKNIDRLCGWAGLEEYGCHPHKFRHSFITHLFDAQADPRAIQQMSGHANINTTMGYASPEQQALELAMSKFRSDKVA